MARRAVGPGAAPIISSRLSKLALLLFVVLLAASAQANNDSGRLGSQRAPSNYAQGLQPGAPIGGTAGGASQPSVHVSAAIAHGSTEVSTRLQAIHDFLWGKEDPQPTPLPLTPRKLGMFTVVILTLLLAASGGIGGGAVFVPLFIVVGGFSTSQAVALSNITVLGGALANFSVNVFRRHPSLDKPLVDWDLIMVMEPTTILGALLGSYLNTLLPVWMTSFLLAGLLVLLTIKLLRRGFAMFAAETAERGRADAQLIEPLLLGDAEAGEPPQAAAGADGDRGGRSPNRRSADSHGSLQYSVQPGDADLSDATPAATRDTGAPAAAAAQQRHGVDASQNAADAKPRGAQRSAFAAAAAQAPAPSSPDGANDILISISSSYPDGLSTPLVIKDPEVRVLNESTHGSNIKIDRSTSLVDRLAHMHAQEQRQVPVGPILLMVLLAAAVVVTDTTKSYFVCGSWQYWLTVLLIVPLCIAVTLLVRHHLLYKAALRSRATAGLQAGSLEFDEELKWDACNTILYPAICSIAGLVAGLFGVGGGIVKSPLMLELGVIPQVAAATSSTMIAFTAGSACVVYAGLGGLLVQYAVVLWVLGFLTTLLGQWGAGTLVKLLKRRSIIIFLMGALMFLSMLASFYQAAVNGTWLWEHPDKAWQRGRICVTAPGTW